MGLFVVSYIALPQRINDILIKRGRGTENGIFFLINMVSIIRGYG